MAGPSLEASQTGGESGSESTGTMDAGPAEHVATGGGGQTGALERRLGVIDLILLGVGASIGSGIFVVTGVAAKEAGPSVTLSFLIAGLASGLDALCYAELSANFPGLVGGAYLYTYAALGELPAFLLFCHLMLDYHVGAASITRALASYLSTLLQDSLPPSLLPLPPFLAPGDMPLLNDALSLSLLAPLLLLAITFLLCRGVRDSVSVNGALTSLKVFIVLLVVLVGAFLVHPSNWSPFAPNGAQAVLATSSVVFFSYIGFDAVANSAEEAKDPQRSVPIGILVSLSACALLYVAVCLVLTGMVPYSALDASAPLSAAFAARGMHWLEAVIDAGAVAGLTTTLLAGLYVQARLYLALARDGLLPPFLAHVQEGIRMRRPPAPGRSKVSMGRTAGEHLSDDGGGEGEGGGGGRGGGEEEHHPIPLNAQLWVGLVAILLAAFFDVSRLSHILSVGVLLSYSLVCICVPLLRLSLPSPPSHPLPPTTCSSALLPQGLSGDSTPGPPLKPLALWGFLLLSLLSLLLGLCTRFAPTLGSSSLLLAILLFVLLLAGVVALSLRLSPCLRPPRGFSCPGVPWVPICGMLVNVYLISQMHVAAWLRLLFVSALALVFYRACVAASPRRRSPSGLCSSAACRMNEFSAAADPLGTPAPSDPLLGDQRPSTSVT